MENGREQNYWPGFVDALSNVVLTLVFVIVIFVFALIMSADKVEKKMQEVIQAQHDLEVQKQAQQSQTQTSSDLAKENEELRQQLAQAEMDLQNLQTSGSPGAASTHTAQLNQVNIDVTKKDEQKPAPKAIGIQVSGDKIVISYPLSIVDLDDKSVTALGHALEDFKSRLGKRKVTVRSVCGDEPFSAARRFAYYRAVNVRNYLISKGIASGDISYLIAQPPTTESGRVEIIFQP